MNRATPQWYLLFSFLATLFLNCQCTPLGIEDSRFVCESSDDCIEGYECRRIESATSPKVCVRSAAAPTSLVFTSSPPSPLRGGTCLPVAVEARTGATAVQAKGDDVLTLTANPLKSALFFSDAACTTPVTTATLKGGNSSVSFFVKPLLGSSITVSAVASFGTASQVLVTTPIVRRGQCVFPPSVLSVHCPFSPAVTDLNASMLWSQTTLAVNTKLGGPQVRCRLSAVDTIACVRKQDSETAADVHFQVVEVPEKMIVQRLTGFDCPASTTLPAAASLSSSFVLKTVANISTAIEEKDSARASISPLGLSTAVALTPATCGGHDVQVIDWEGVTVTRGVVAGSLFTGNQLELTVPAGSANSALLIQPVAATGSNLCRTMVRGSIGGPTSLVFNRGAGAASCTGALSELLYERIDFGAKALVKEYTTTLAAGEIGRGLPITPVDSSRTLLFASSQMAGGQGAGETDNAGKLALTEGLFRTELTDGATVTISRASSNSAAAITFYVVELTP